MKENNELIAEFIQRPYMPVCAGFERKTGSVKFIDKTFLSRDECLVYCDEVNGVGTDPDECFYPLPVPEGFSDYRLKYDTSWDWLMPVVEKIETSLKWKYSVATEINLYEHGNEWHTVIYDEGNATRLEMPGEDSRIISVYKAVVEFIKLYNTKQQEQTQP